jgi:nucleoside-diphosphate-sugar epimerase
MKSPRPRVLILGAGYVGNRLAQRLSATHQVTAVVRSAQSAEPLKQHGIETLQLDIDDGRSRALLLSYTMRAEMFYLIPPAPLGESDPRLSQLLNQIVELPSSLVYMGTTGVYGDHGGGMVDETTTIMPVSARARRRASAEDITRIWCTENQVRRVVLRVPGIYGPGRLPLERLQSNEPVIRRDEAGITNHIHVDDLVSICVASLDPDARGIYNASDGNAISSTDFIERVARHAGLEPPPQVSMDEAQLTFSPERLSFLNESRRVDNRRLLRELNVELRYGDIDEGIEHSLSEMGALPKRP